jgi:hypothetical protein
MKTEKDQLELALDTTVVRRRLVQTTGFAWGLTAPVLVHEQPPPCTGFWLLDLAAAGQPLLVWYDIDWDVWKVPSPALAAYSASRQPKWYDTHKVKAALSFRKKTSPELPVGSTWVGLALPAPVGYSYEVPGTEVGAIQRRPVTSPG